MKTSVRYQGSPYHKRNPSAWGAPGLKSDKTECPPELDTDVVAALLETAITESIGKGWCSKARDGDWPRYVWGRSPFLTVSDTTIELVWEARVCNRGVPTYKAYPVDSERHSNKMPRFVREQLWPDR